MAESISIDFRKPIALFPLPNCVLLPHASIPLHIFEPRYRHMVRDVLDTQGLIAMTLFDGDAWKEDYQGEPPLKPVVCVGYLAQHDQVEDGRYYILLQGICRARIVEEVGMEDYRAALLEPLETAATMQTPLTTERQRIESLLKDAALLNLAVINGIHRWLNDDMPTPVVIDRVGMTLLDRVEDRYALLAEVDPVRRAAMLENHLRDMRRVIRHAQTHPARLTEEGHCLN